MNIHENGMNTHKNVMNTHENGMNIHEIDTVIYDFDGTIMDTNNVVIQSWQYTYRELTGRDGRLEEILKTFGEPLGTSMRKLFPDVPEEEAVDIYRSWHRNHFEEMIDLFPGVKDMMLEVKARGYKTGIATSRVAETLYQGIEKFGIEDCFDAIVTVEEVTKHKPDPESILVTLDKLGSRPENSIMLGDSIFDILCARNAGAKAALVGWSASLAGKGLADFPEHERPDCIIKTPAELFDVI